jgi:hypothetical protein
MNSKEQINAIQRILKGSNNNLSYSQKLEAVLSWADIDSPENFDNSFLESLKVCNSLSERQQKSIDNIINKFDIKIEKYI